MKLDSLHDLFIIELQDLYDAEQQITQALPQLLPIVNSPALKEAMQHHLTETEEQITKLETVCQNLGIEPVGKQCVGMEGILEESVELLQDNPQPSAVLDAALIGALQKVEHYEICGYGSAAAYAKQMGHTDAMDILIEIMNEEKKTDEELTRLAEGMINEQADASQNGKYAM